MKMALSGRLVSVLIVRFLWLLLSCSLSYGTESDIYCLKSIKASLEDPNKYFKSSWNFSNNANKGFICAFTGVQCRDSELDVVLNIRLSHVGLKGQFPRGIQNCSNLQDLNLSGNKLSGSIPSDIVVLIKFVTSLDLSSNNFSWVIPENFANCSYLNVLKLDHNRLTGLIPARLGLLDRIKTFNVANNLLTGQVPTFTNATFGADSYANNLGLCGAPLEPCQAAAGKSHTLVIVAAGAVGGAFGLGIGMFSLLRRRVSKEEGRPK